MGVRAIRRLQMSHLVPFILQRKFLIFGLLILIFSYLPGVLGPQIVSDDYAFIYSNVEFANLALGDGRYVSYLLLNLVPEIVPRNTIVITLRVIGFICLILSALITYFIVSNLIISNQTLGKTNYVAFLTLPVFCIPGFQIFAHTAYGVTLSLALFLSTLAGYLFLRFDIERKHFYQFFAILLLVLSMATYQGSSLFLLNFFALEFLLRNNEKFRWMTLCKRVMGVVAAALIYFFSIIFLRIVNEIKLKDRFSLVGISDLPEKIVWFISRPLTLSYMPFTLRSPSWFEVLILAGLSFGLIILALYVMSKKSLPKTIELFGVLIITQVLLMGPLLVASQNQVEPRFLVQGQWLTAYLSILGLLHVFLSLGSNLPFFLLSAERVAKAFLVVAVFVGLLVTNQRYYVHIFQPYQQKIAFLKNEISACRLQEVSTVYVQSRDRPWPTKELLGVWSQTTDLASDWVPVPAVMTLLDSSIKVELFDERITHINYGTDVCVVNLNDYTWAG